MGCNFLGHVTVIPPMCVLYGQERASNERSCIQRDWLIEFYIESGSNYQLNVSVNFCKTSKFVEC